MGQDLRSYLDTVKRRKSDEFQVISRPIDPAYEITALVVKLEKERRKRPVLLFRSEEHTSELQSQSNLVCRLLLEKKKKRLSLKIYRYSHTCIISIMLHTPCR